MTISNDSYMFAPSEPYCKFRTSSTLNLPLTGDTVSETSCRKCQTPVCSIGPREIHIETQSTRHMGLQYEVRASFNPSNASW